MNSSRIALWAAVAATAAWTFKSIAIAAAGGLDKSPLEGPLFFTGLISFVVAAVALGIAAVPRAATWLRALAGVAGFAAGLGLTLAVDAIVGSFHASGAERHWVWVEFNLWVAALTALTLTVLVHRSRQDAHRAPLTTGV